MPASLNIEYLIVRTIELITNIPVNVGEIPGTFMFVVQVIATVGMVVSVVLLVLLVYFRIRLIQVEHHGFHELEEKERLMHEDHTVAAKNPRWEMIATFASSQNESDWRRAIIEADIMLGSLLTERGYPGTTIGDQLKAANPLQFTTLNLAWEAHRVRNAIAHLGDAYPLSERDVRATIDQYRRVFEEFDYV